MSRFILAAILACVPGLGQSQLGTGAIAGTVLDPSSAPVAGANVTATQVATRLTRTSTTSGEGTFSLPVLPTGTYTARVEAPGFSVLEQTNVEVTVGSTRTLKLDLQIGAVAETITVESTVLVDSTKTSEDSLVNFKQIQDLPINGRRADQFALLVPGVTRDGRFGLLSYRGQAGIFNNYMIEGNDDNQAFFGQSRGRDRIASNVSANAVQEFQVGKGAFLAEFGRAAGGSINAVLRSGTNSVHGDGFWYFRNRALNARDPLASIKPDERRDQFGGSISGPLKSDKLFYFFNYDQQIRNFPIVVEDTGNVLRNGAPVLPNNPTQAQRDQYATDLRAFETGVNFLRGKFPGGAPGNTLPRNANQELWLLKTDYHISSGHTLSAFFNHLNARGENAIQSPIVLGNVGRNGRDDVRIWAANTRLTSTFGGNKVNELRFQWSRNHEYQISDQEPPQVFVGNFSYGAANFLPRYSYPDERKIQFIDNFSYIAGTHSFKWGGEVNRTRDIIDSPANFTGTYNYSNALTFGRDVVAAGAARGNYSSYTQSFGLSGIDFATLDYALYFQDQWKPHRQLTVNYGVRWDYQQLPEPRNPNPAIPETQRFHADKNNFGPRIGIAWDVTGDGKTVLRTGYGMYYGRTTNGMLQNALRQTGLFDPERATVSINLNPSDPAAPRFPATLTNLSTALRTTAPNVYRLDSNFGRPRIQDMNFGIERQLGRNLILTASWLWTQGDAMPLLYDANLPAPQFERTYRLPDGQIFRVPFVAGVTRTATGQSQNANNSRPDPRFGSIFVNASEGQTWYKALFLELKKRYASGLQFGFAYTFAKAENLTGSGDGGGIAAENAFGGGRQFNQFDRGASRGLSPMDQRHRGVVNWVYDLPAYRGDHALLRALANRYRVSGIFTGESGRAVATLLSIPQLPFSTPDGTQWNGYGGVLGQGGPNFLPIVPRNGEKGDSNYRFDLRLARDIALTERLRIELLGEAFNLLNRSNYNGFFTTAHEAVSTTAATPLATPVQLNANTRFFRPTNSASQPDGTNARRFQLALRFRF